MGDFQWVEIPHAGIRYIMRKSDGQSLPADMESVIVAAGETIDDAVVVDNAEGIRRAAAQQAMQAVDWQGELDDINAGKALVAQMTATVAPGRALVTAIRGDAAIPAATRTRIADAMDGLITNQVTTATILNALINKHHQNGTWWWTLMRLMTLSDE